MFRRKQRTPPIEPSRPDSLPVPHRTSPAGLLIGRAETAVNRIRVLAPTPGDPWLREHIADVDAQSTEALGGLRMLGGRVTLAEQSIAAADPARLAQEVERLQSALETTTDPGLREAQEASIRAVREQIDVAARLTALRQSLLTRMEPAVLGLEGVATRMGEIIAIGVTPIEQQRITELVDGLTLDLVALRGGLEEAERLAERDRPPELEGPQP